MTTYCFVYILNFIINKTWNKFYKKINLIIMKIIKKEITYYNYLISPKIRLIIKLIKIILISMTLLNTSPDWYTYIDYVVKNGLEDSEVAYELELTEKQKWYAKIGCIIASITFSIFIIYVLKNYNITPEPPTQSIENNNVNVIKSSINNTVNTVVTVNDEELDGILNSALDEYEYNKYLTKEAEKSMVNPFDQIRYDKAESELKAYIEANTNNTNLLVHMPKILELEKKIEIAQAILNKSKVE